MSYIRCIWAKLRRHGRLNISSKFLSEASNHIACHSGFLSIRISAPFLLLSLGSSLGFSSAELVECLCSTSWLSTSWVVWGLASLSLPKSRCIDRRKSQTCYPSMRFCKRSQRSRKLCQFLWSYCTARGTCKASQMYRKEPLRLIRSTSRGGE